MRRMKDRGFDGKWLVLDSRHTNDGQPGMYLVSLNLIGDEQGEDILFRDIGDVSVSFSNRERILRQSTPAPRIIRAATFRHGARRSPGPI